MLERVIENWLTSATEKTFQLPFCYILLSKGYKVVHLTRHCAMELGKDIIAIDPNGVPCAFQLKSVSTSRMTYSQWRDIQSQMLDLVHGRIVHPSVECDIPHRSYLVVNKGLDEEVIRSIQDMNAGFLRMGLSTLEVISGGELLSDAKTLGSSLWPSELSDTKSILELYLHNGSEPLPKMKLASLLKETFNIKEQEERLPSQAKLERLLSSGALLCSIATSSFSSKENYFAEVESWTIYLAYAIGLIDKWNLEERYWRSSVNLAFQALQDTLDNLYREITEKDSLFEGDKLTDKAFSFTQMRSTYVVAYMAIYSIILRMSEQNEKNQDKAAKIHDEIILKYKSQMLFWGESSVPFFLVYYWYWKVSGESSESEKVIIKLLADLCAENKPGSSTAFCNPYYHLEELLPHLTGIAKAPIEDRFDGSSYMLQSLVSLCARRGLKELISKTWKDITYIKFKQFIPDNPDEFFHWRVKSGNNLTVMPTWTQSWKKLQEESNDIRMAQFPGAIERLFPFVLLFLLVLPHRTTNELVKYVDSKFDENTSSFVS